jgi:hypothetical protein
MLMNQDLFYNCLCADGHFNMTGDIFYNVTGQAAITAIRKFASDGQKFYNEAVSQPFMPIHRQREMKRALDKLIILVSEAETEFKNPKSKKMDNFYRKTKRAYNDVANTQWKNKAWGTVKKYFPLSSASRNAFLGLVRINMFNLAAKAERGRKNAEKDDKKASENWAKLKYRWVQIGGDWDSLLKAIEAGKDKNAPLTSKKYNVGGGDDAGVLILASSILSALGRIFTALGGGSSSDLNSGDGEIPSEVLSQGESDLKADGADEILDEDRQKKIYTIIAIVAASITVITLGVLLFYSFKKDK